MNSNKLWDNNKSERCQQYSPQLSESINSIPHNPNKLEYANDQTSLSAIDTHISNDISSQPPLQPSPNIVDQISFSNTSPMSK